MNGHGGSLLCIGERSACRHSSYMHDCEGRLPPAVCHVQQECHSEGRASLLRRGAVHWLTRGGGAVHRLSPLGAAVRPMARAELQRGMTPAAVAVQHPEVAVAVGRWHGGPMMTRPWLQPPRQNGWPPALHPLQPPQSLPWRLGPAGQSGTAPTVSKGV